MNKIKLDENLWFFHKDCKGEHYLIGNPHTFPGRILAWCPIKECSFYISSSEIEDRSMQSDYWIKGYLIGNQPAPPTNEEGMTDFESEKYMNWKRKIEIFKSNGVWEMEE